jgi:hypothetical protein
MHKKIQEAIDLHLSCIKSYNDTEADLELCEKLFPNAQISLNPSQVNIYWVAKSISEVKANLALLAKNGIMLERFSPHDTDPVWILKGLYVQICLRPQWQTETEEGATCRLVQIGIRQSEPVPIFKLMCDGKFIEEEMK